MTKKEQQKEITKRFLNTVDEIYGLIDSEEGESGTINFDIDVKDKNDVPFQFNYRRSYCDVLSWKMKGEVDYDKAYDLECELQSILHKISTQVEEL